MLNVEAAIERLVMSTNKCACSTSFLFVLFTHKSLCYSNKPLIGVEPTNRVCEYGPRSPTHFFVLDQLTLFNSVDKQLRTIRGSLKVEVAKKVELEEHITKEGRRLEKFREYPGEYDDAMKEEITK